MNSVSNYPLGEETWLHRGISSRGALFYTREFTHVVLLLIFTLGMIVSPLILVTPHLSSAPLWFSVSAWMAMAVLLAPLAAVVGKCVLPRLSICPLWVYAEQLTPEKLVIYRASKTPISINLTGALISSRSRMKYYTTLTITRNDSTVCARLPVLTPVEYDRFMQYWNAANP